jgi:hypothetical protein
VRLRRGTLTPAEITVVDGLPVTTVERTILDLLADHTDGGHVGDMIADAARRGVIDPDTLAAKSGAHAAKYGIRRRDGHALLTALLDQSGDGDTRRRAQMATLLSTLDSRQRRALLDLTRHTDPETR